MRRLPYSDSEIVIAMETTARLFASPYYTERNSGRFPQDLSPWDEAAEYVDFGPNEDGCGAYSRALVSRSALVRAFADTFVSAALKNRPDLSDPKVQHHFLWFPCRPWNRFSFDGLRHLMVHEIIPTQLVRRVSSEGNEHSEGTWIAFSPTELKTFGLA